MNVALVVVGVAILLVITLDQFATIAGTGPGSGIIVSRIQSTVWGAALRAHRRWPSHRALSALGVALLVSAPLLWAGFIWAGFSLIFSAEGAVVEADTLVPASVLGRIYYAGFTIFTLGLGDVSPGNDGWRIATALASFTGLAMITLGITYLVPVVQAATGRRQLARMLRSLDTTVELTAEGSPDVREEALELLMQQRDSMAQVTEQHLSHAVLRYYHASDATLSLPVRLATLHGQLGNWSSRNDNSDTDALRLDLVTRSVEELACAIARDPDSQPISRTLEDALESDGRAERFKA